MSEALLIDADPWSGGIDLILGSEGDTGLRWPDLAMQGGRLSYPALRDALPQRGGVTVLSGSRIGGDIDAAPLGAVIDAGSRGGATVICDLPRRSTGAVETVLDAADLVVVIAPADVRSCAAAAAIVPWVSAVNPNAGVVVRGPSPGGLRSADVAKIVGLPLLAAMRAQPGVADALERGGLRLRHRSPLATAARSAASTATSPATTPKAPATSCCRRSLIIKRSACSTVCFLVACPEAFWASAINVSSISILVRIGDPSCDLVIAWTFIDQAARGIFRSAVTLDPTTWKRARGWAIWKAMITLVQLRDASPIEAEKQRWIIRDVLDDHSRATKQAE